MVPRRPWAGLRRWLVWVWEHVPFIRRTSGPGPAGVREPRRPRPPFRPPQAMAADPDPGGRQASAVATLTRSRQRRMLWRWHVWRRRPHAGPA